MTERFVNYTAETTLAATIDAVQTSLSILPVAGSPALPNFRIRIDDELILVTDVAGAVYTGERGIEGTTPAAHAQGSAVHYVLTAGALSDLVLGLPEDLAALELADTLEAAARIAADALEAAARIAADSAEATTRASADTAEAAARLAADDLEAAARIAGDAAGDSGLADHVAAADPHPLYQLRAEKNIALGYAGLDAASKLDGAWQVYGIIGGTAAEGNDARLSDARVPLAHDHSIAEITGLGAVLSGLTAALTGVVYTSDVRLSDARVPLAHATSHKLGGSDVIKLDELAAPTDVTTLNATAALHGLLPKLSGVAGQFLNGVGAWVVPAELGVTSITGTANQVVASGAIGAVTLSLPQSIHTGATPTFGGLSLTGAFLTTGRMTLGDEAANSENIVLLATQGATPSLTFDNGNVGLGGANINFTNDSGLQGVIATRSAGGININAGGQIGLQVGALDTLVVYSSASILRSIFTGLVGIGVPSQIPTARLHLAGNLSFTAWTTNGIALNSAAASYTDTTSTGTVATQVVHSFGVPTLLASSATVYTNASNVYIAGPPTASTNVTITNPWALYVATGNTYLGGSLIFSGDTTLVRLAPDILAMQRGTAQQQFRVYGGVAGADYMLSTVDGGGVGYIYTSLAASSLYFGVGSATYVRVTNSAFRPVTDNGWDIGAGNTRFRNGFFGTGIGVGVIANITGHIYVGGDAAALHYQDTAAAATSSQFYFRRSRGTQATRTDVVAEDVTMELASQSWSGAQYWSSTRIKASVDGAVTTAQAPPSRLDFYTCPGNAAAAIALTLNAAQKAIFTGDLSLSTVGKGLAIKEGTNATMGRSVLVGGTVTVATTKVTATSEIFLTVNVPGGTVGFLQVSARVVGTSFTILSSNGADTSTIGWIIVEPS